MGSGILWLMPDLMTMIAVMNSSLLPTWNNVDGYAETLIRQAYLAAWDMYHASFDMDAPGSLFDATAQEPRIRAEVSFARVFAWLGVSLLMTVGGVLLLLLALRGEGEEPDVPSEVGVEEREEAMSEVKDIIKDLDVLGFF